MARKTYGPHDKILPPQQFNLFSQPDEIDLALGTEPPMSFEDETMMRLNLIAEREMRIFAMLYISNLKSHEIEKWLTTACKVFGGKTPIEFYRDHQTKAEQWMDKVKNVPRANGRRNVPTELLS